MADFGEAFIAALEAQEDRGIKATLEALKKTGAVVYEPAYDEWVFKPKRVNGEALQLLIRRELAR